MRVEAYAEVLSLLGDESRLRLCALLAGRELRVTDLVQVTGISQPRVSTHLGRLREAGLVRDRRDGPQSFYALGEASLPPALRAVIDEAARSSDPLLEADRRRLRELEDAKKRGPLDALAGEMERHYSPGRTWQSLASGLAALLDLGDVLDVGSGDGAVASRIAPYARSITCVDANAKMIEACARRLADVEGVRALVADAHDLPFRAASFDAVLLFHTLAYAERPDRVVDACARVLRPDGRLVVLSLDKHDHAEVTAPYGERHAGFSPRALRGLATRAGLDVTQARVACKESKKPHFQVVLLVAKKPEAPKARAVSRAREPR